MQRKQDKEVIAARCRAKYPRGLNLMIVEQEEIDNQTFMPGFFIGDRGRIFLTYERLLTDAFDEPPPDNIKEACKNAVDTYDPMKTILFLWVLMGKEGEYYLVSIDI